MVGLSAGLPSLPPASTLLAGPGCVLASCPSAGPSPAAAAPAAVVAATAPGLVGMDGSAEVNLGWDSAMRFADGMPLFVASLSCCMESTEDVRRLFAQLAALFMGEKGGVLALSSSAAPDVLGREVSNAFCNQM